MSQPDASNPVTAPPPSSAPPIDRSPWASLLPVPAAQWWRELVYLLSGMVLGTLWFTVLVTGWSTALGLLFAIVGFPLVLLVLSIGAWAATGERALARTLLGAQIPERRPWGSPRGTAFSTRLWRGVRDPRTWAEQSFLFLRFFVGLPLGVAAISLVSTVVACFLAPFAVAFSPSSAHFYINIGIWKIDSVWGSLVFFVIGAVLVLPTIWAVHGLAAFSRGMAEILLSVPGDAVDDDPPPGSEARRRREALAAAADRTLVLNAAIVAMLVVVSILVWALAGAGFFWPMCVLVGLGIPVAMQAAAARILLLPDPRQRWFLLHTTIALGLLLLCVALWAWTGHTSAWPAWVALGLGTALLVHAVIAFAGRLLPGDEQRELQARVERLTETRAGAVDVQATELERIERDLHDGAQARLVSMTMTLGLASEHVDDDPERVKELLLEARDQARVAIGELRDLARGIAPPILIDRGLPAAVGALVGRAPVPLSVTADLTDRLPAAVERAGYFVVAEAVANAAKHAGASAIDVRLRRELDVLTVEITDDGRGGANAAGSGLLGLRQRVEALDGTFAVISPAGGPTTIRAELSCGS